MRCLRGVLGGAGLVIARRAIGCADGEPSAHKGTQGDPGTVIKPTGGAEGPGPTASSIGLPSQPSGDISMDVALTGMRGGTPVIALEISRDGGASFSLASIGPTTPGD